MKSLIGWRTIAMAGMAVTGCAAGVAGATGAGGTTVNAIAVEHQATGDWGFSPLIIKLSLPAPALVTPLRLECFSSSGCTADNDMVFGPRDSNGHTIHFSGTTANSQPLLDSSGHAIGRCTLDPAPSGDVACVVVVKHVQVPWGGWIGTNRTITYTKFTPTGAGEPLAGDGWTDNPRGVNPGNNPDNDDQLMVTRPSSDPIWVFMDPTAVAFAAGQAPQSDEVGLMCSTEAFCDVRAGVSFRATLAPAGVHFPAGPGTTQIRPGADIDFRCRYTDTGDYKGPGSNLVSCVVISATVIDHYGIAEMTLPMEATRSAYPQHRAYKLTLSPAAGASGSGVFSDLRVLPPLAVKTPSHLPAATVGQGVTVGFRASGGVPRISSPFEPPKYERSWSLLAGRLPPGLQLKRATLAGTPTRSGLYCFVLRVTDDQGDVVYRTFHLTISP